MLAQLGAVQLALGNDEAARGGVSADARIRSRIQQDALSGLVVLEIKGRRTGDVRRRVEAAVAAHPQDTDYLLLAARLYAADDDAARTESTLRRVLDIDRANESATLSLAVFLHEHQRADEAKRLLEDFVQQRPRSVEAQTALGRLLEKTGHPAEARAQYEKIVALNPRAAEAAFRLASIYVAQGDNLDVAMTLAAGAKQLLPDDPAVNDVVGSVYARKGPAGGGLAVLSGRRARRAGQRHLSLSPRIGVSRRRTPQAGAGRVRTRAAGRSQLRLRGAGAPGASARCPDDRRRSARLNG